MKIELAHIACRKLGLVYYCVEIGRGQYLATYFRERVADTVIRSDLHHGSPFVYSPMIRIDPARSNRYPNFVPASMRREGENKKWGTKVRVEQLRSDHIFYLDIFFESDIYSVDENQEVRYVNFTIRSQRRPSQ